MKDKRKFWIGLGVLILIVVLFLILFLKKDKKKPDELNVYETSSNYSVADDTIQFLYERYHPEDDLKFQIVGSDSSQEDEYAFYYKKDKVGYEDFSSIYKSYILLDLINYKDHSLDESRNCYFYSLDEFQDTYQKYYGSLDGFEINTSEDFSPHFYLDEDNLCITSDEEISSNNYQKTLDTYMINAFYQGNQIIIYERVAFIRVTDKVLEFYKDYDMKELVYSLDREKADIGFIGSSQVVSNVLIHYQDEFPLYQYTYIKGESTYYLESITK